MEREGQEDVLLYSDTREPATCTRASTLLSLSLSLPAASCSASARLLVDARVSACFRSLRS